MVKQIILFLATFLVFESYGQNLSIELSIEWKHEESDIYSKLNNNEIPFLKIRYNNLTCDSIYLPKIYKNHSYLPQFTSGTIFAEFKLSDFNNISVPHTKWNVFIGGIPPNNIQWEVLADSIDYYSEHEVGEINQKLSDIYDSVFRFGESNNTKYDKISEIKEHQILGKFKEDFVFLTPNSNHTECYSLVGFKMLGGCYSFLLAVNKISEFLPIAPSWSAEQDKWIFKEVKLPDKAADYHLYSGKYYTNKVTVIF